MTSQAAIHKRNLESSILFMQQEHSDTLKALHEEIQKLQKKCTDLTFQLTMHGLNIDESDDSTNSKFQEVKKQLDEQIAVVKSKETQLGERDVRIKELEHTVKAYKKKYLDETRQHSQVVNNLKAELETKSCTIAYLTSKLHQLKTQAKAESESENIPKRGEAMRIPVPPTDIMSKPRRSANIRRNSSSHGSETLSIHPVRLSSTRSSSGSNRSNSPDLTAFLPPQKEKPLPYNMPKPSVLPPIATNPEARILVHQVVHPQRMGHPSASKTSEIATLAVDQLPLRRKNFVNHQESHSSDYK